MIAIGYAVRDGDGIAFRLVAGPRRGCYCVEAGEVDDLLAGRAPAALRVDGVPVGVVAPSRSLRLLVGAFWHGRVPARRGGLPTRRATFLVPRLHLCAHYDRDDGPVPVLAGGLQDVTEMCRPVAGPGEGA